jgi:tetratricopeptide (TPR) repeat protein
VRTLAVALLVLLGAVIAEAAPLGHAEALAALDAGSVETRRLGAVSLAEHGTMQDVPRLARALSDPDPLVRALVERGLWDVWSRSGDEEVDTFTRVIERRPDFAEGWNKRATVLYLLGEYARSLADCDEVMKRNPYHFGALSGYGMIHLKLGDLTRALTYFERALAVNPNLGQVRETTEALRQEILQRRKDAI